MSSRVNAARTPKISPLKVIGDPWNPRILIRSGTLSQLNADDSSYVQIFEPAQLSLQTSSGTGPERVTQFANPWHSRCLKCFEFENASNKMNPSQNKIPI